MEIKMFHSGCRVVATLFLLAIVSACASTSYQPMKGDRQYSADELIQEWKKNAGTLGYPLDNDTEYLYPKPSPKGYVVAPQPIYPADNDAEYIEYRGGYPKYNPDADNNPLYYLYDKQGQKVLPTDNDSEYSYPLYFD